MSNAVAVTDATFEQEIEKHDGLAVVDFWATWCGPCRIISPILDQLSVEVSYTSTLLEGVQAPSAQPAMK